MWKAIQAAYEAGGEIMKIYNTDFEVDYKADESPLTEADQASHNIIVRALGELEPDTPILSEEGNHQSYEERSQWSEFWLIDPLDGTKEFVKKNGEFTVNIAKITNGHPATGIIYAPVLDTMYYGDKEQGAFKMTQFSEKAGKLANLEEFRNEAQAMPISQSSSQVKVVASRSHMSEETKAFIQEIKDQGRDVETLSAGSSLKLCLVAEGSAQYYPRYAPTMEWDTGAGQAIVEAAGGKVEVADSSEPLVYNKENLRNPWFLARL